MMLRHSISFPMPRGPHGGERRYEYGRGRAISRFGHQHSPPLLALPEEIPCALIFGRLFDSARFLAALTFGVMGHFTIFRISRPMESRTSSTVIRQRTAVSPAGTSG